MQDHNAIARLPLAAVSSGASAGSPACLDRLSKAAIIVRLLLNEGADIPLEDLPDELQARLPKPREAALLLQGLQVY